MRPLRKIGNALASVVDPRTYAHGFRMLHYYSYSHVKPGRRVQVGPGTTIAPNVSITNGERINIGSGTKIGAHCYLWAGDGVGRITIGDGCRLAPEVFVTASNYGSSPGASFLEQPRDEADVVIGDHVWLGARVFVGAGVTIGDHCIVGAGAVVTHSLPPGAIALGVPARVVRVRET
jgi:acetyltransferase-like isoleucine patch superfamily enzyme